MTFARIARRSTVAVAAALALAACGSDDSATPDVNQVAAPAEATETTLGSASADAPADTTAETAPAETAPPATAADELASSDDRPADWDPSEPYGYGDDAGFDALWDACAAGDGDACSELFWTSPGDSAYEEYGLDQMFATDGGFGDDDGDDDRVTTGDPLADALAMERPADWDPSEPFTYGDDAEFDALWDACDDGDAEACSDLFWNSPLDSAYEAFGLDKSFE